MKRRRNPIVQGLTVGASLVFAKVTAMLPLPFACGLAAALAWAAYYAVPRIRNVGFANLDLAYGDSLSESEKRRILWQSVRHVAMTAAEFSRMPSLNPDGFAQLVRIVGRELLPETGFLCVGGHFGNWEWMAPAMASTGRRIAEIVRPLDDPRLNRVIDATRRDGGVETIPKEDAGREIIHRLREGIGVGVLIDQSPRRNGVPVTFFGAPCWATIAPAMIAARAKVPVHPVAMVREADGRHTLHIYPAIELANSGNLRNDLVENTQRCQDAFERIVRAHPEQWMWFHRRWKHREFLESEWSAKFEKATRDRNAGNP